jgi:heme-degrading monooxygenase HmoA
MPLVAVTRLRVRSWRFLPGFIWFSSRSVRQARRAAGNLGVEVRKAEGLAFWTVTVWQDEAAMRAFRDTQPHKDAMPRLLSWCDEASLAHWNQDASAVPDWKTAEERLANSGRLSKVHHPSPDQQVGRLDFRQS